MSEKALGLQDLLKNKDVEYRMAAPLSELSYLRLGGTAAAVVYPDTEQKLTDVLRYLVKENIKHRTVGRMTNLLPPPDIYEGVLVKTDRLVAMESDGCSLTVQAGRGLPSLASELLRLGFSGFEELSGIPASVGGAVYMNAGAYGREISEILVGARLYDEAQDAVVYMKREELCFSYRRSALQGRALVLLSADLAFARKDSLSVGSAMRRCAEKRRESQPVAFPSLGSVFKKSGGQSAGYFIDKAGLKGLAVGGAEVSRKHAGFIINRGGATADDYRKLVALVKMKVLDAFGVMLEEEIEYLE